MKIDNINRYIQNELDARYSGVTCLDDSWNRWSVTSSDGKRQYRVTFEGRGDSDESLWECDCPARNSCDTCKHLRLVWYVIDELRNVDSDEWDK